MHISIIDIVTFPHANCVWLGWIDHWSLTLDLRTISTLVPTHITHVYVQWMSYLFV